jgi:hypothetical protein
MCASKDVRLLRAFLLAHIGCRRVDTRYLTRCLWAAAKPVCHQAARPSRFPSHTRLSEQRDYNPPAMAQNGVVR